MDRSGEPASPARACACARACMCVLRGWPGSTVHRRVVLPFHPPPTRPFGHALLVHNTKSPRSTQRAAGVQKKRPPPLRAVSRAERPRRAVGSSWPRCGAWSASAWHSSLSSRTCIAWPFRSSPPLLSLCSTFYSGAPARPRDACRSQCTGRGGRARWAAGNHGTMWFDSWLPSIVGGHPLSDEMSQGMAPSLARGAPNHGLEHMVAKWRLRRIHSHSCPVRIPPCPRRLLGGLDGRLNATHRYSQPRDGRMGTYAGHGDTPGNPRPPLANSGHIAHSRAGHGGQHWRAGDEIPQSLASPSPSVTDHWSLSGPGPTLLFPTACRR